MESYFTTGYAHLGWPEAVFYLESGERFDSLARTGVGCVEILLMDQYTLIGLKLVSDHASGHIVIFSRRQKFRDFTDRIGYSVCANGTIRSKPIINACASLLMVIPSRNLRLQSLWFLYQLGRPISRLILRHIQPTGCSGVSVAVKKAASNPVIRPAAPACQHETVSVLEAGNSRFGAVWQIHGETQAP